MDRNLVIRRLAVHYVDRKINRLELAKKEQNVEDLNPIVIDFLLKIVNDIWDAEDAGNINSGKFSGSDPTKQLAEKQIKIILEDEALFFDASIKLAQHLYAESPGNASTGLLTILKLERSFDKETFVAILKIQLKDEKFVRLGDRTLTQITVEDVQNLLLDQIQKGAIYPHPTKPIYDLKVIDKQVDDPAKYFREGFLGCFTKKSDEHQVKSLLPTIKRYAKHVDLPFATVKVPNFINSLRDQRRNITTPLVARTIKEQDILGSEFDYDDFVNYVEGSSSLGVIDIPQSSFERRPVKKYVPRLFIVKFHDPKYRGVEFSIPTNLVDDIISTEGDTVTFTIKTTKDGFKFDYE